MNSLAPKRQSTHARGYVALCSLFALMLLVCLVPAFKTVNASDPTSGTLNPTLGAATTWRGTAPGGSSESEDTCVEGFNCDTYALTFSGNSGDWNGKNVSIKILADLPSTDYDLVVHKGACNAPEVGACTGAAVGNSGNSPGQPEEVVLSPADIGTGLYSVRVIYFAATTADQYRGSATVIAGEVGNPTPTPTPTNLPPSCTPPGTEVLTDPAGDQLGAPEANQQLDIVKLSIAEPVSAVGEEKLAFSIDVADLSSIPPSATWRAQFVSPGMTAPTTYYYASAESDPLGAVTFFYGRIEGTSVADAIPTDGMVDTANKRFIINVPRSGVGSPTPGQNLTDVHVRTQQLVGVLLVQIDTTRVANNLKIYTLRGNAVCSPATPTPTATPSPTPFIDPPDAPRYANHQAPQGLGNSAGEPTLGANWATDKVMYIAGLEVLRVSFNDCTSPSTVTWEPTNQVITNANTLDPILFTDNDTGNGANRTNRTFVSQLAAADGSSLFEFTDNDGQSYTPGAKGSGIGSGVDHQTVGGGPYAPNSLGIGPSPGSTYPNAVYYASQNIGYANLARSDNGGLNFGPAIPMYDLTECGGLHGHIKVAPDGTIYVPNKGCGGLQAMAVSVDNGLTFEVRKVPGSKPGRSDPSIGIGAPDSVTGISPIYFGYTNGDGRPRIAVSRDKGVTWINDQNVGLSHNIKSTVFPAVVAGDSDRAAFFFLGSTVAGGTDDDAAGTADSKNSYSGVWNGYIATTYDGGATWVTVNATPKDPVQRGVVCTNGTTCPSGTRNLLDFNDVTIDKEGRALAAYADGCITESCIQGQDKNNDGVLNTRFDNDGSDKATIIRQTGGKTLHAAFDVSGPRVPSPPRTTAFYNPDTDSVTIRWEQPESESPITNYKVFRTRGGTETLLATVGPNVFTYEDTDGTPTDLYRVAAVNAVGESPASCGTVAPVVLQSPCNPPGRLASIDTSDAAPNLPPDPGVDIDTVSFAEPSTLPNHFVITLKVKNFTGGTPPPNTAWYVIWNRPVPDPDPNIGTDRNYVVMKTTGFGVATYEYGKLTKPSGNVAMTGGTADAGEFKPDGTIQITIAKDKVDSPAVGSTVVGILARTYLGRAEQPSPNQNTSSDYSTEGTYIVVGNGSCVGGTTGLEPGKLIISEFRLRGFAGATDEFVELYNTTDQPITVATGDASAGFALVASDGAIRFVVPNNAIIPARGHYLITNSSGYSLGGYAVADTGATYTADIDDNSGIALFRTATLGSLTEANRLDAAGFGNVLFTEGNAIPPISADNGEYSFVRKMTTGLPQDTGDNAADFAFVSTDAGAYGRTGATPGAADAPSELGSPGPENTTSPIQRNSTIKASLINRNCSGFGAANSGCGLYRTGSDSGPNAAFGTLSIRRKFTNRTGQTITQLRFRAVNVSTLNSTGYNDTQQADLRTLDSMETTVTDADGNPVTIRSMTVERMPGQAGNYKGGGHNTTLRANLAGSLAPNASVNVQFRLGVERNGRFRYLVNVEAITTPPPSFISGRKVVTFGKPTATQKAAPAATRRGRHLRR
jgi:hypothetical protein